MSAAGIRTVPISDCAIRGRPRRAPRKRSRPPTAGTCGTTCASGFTRAPPRTGPAAWAPPRRLPKARTSRSSREQEEQEDEQGLAGRTRRRHAQVRQLLAAGHGTTAVARALGLSAPTVRKYAAAASPGEITAAARDCVLDPFKPWLIQRWNDGTRNAMVLHAEITAQGYQGSAQQVRRYVRPFRDLPGPAPEPPPAVPSARQVTSWLTTRPGNLAENDAAALAAVTAACPHLEELGRHTRAFAEMMTSLTGYKDLDGWLAAAAASSLPPLQSFARGIARDHDAVLAGADPPLQQRQSRRHRQQDQNAQAPDVRPRLFDPPPPARHPRLTSESNHH